MARAGDVIVNPVTRERIVFLETGEETGGERLRADLFVQPGGFVAAEHVHPAQQERFVVRSGTLRLRVRGEERVCTAGDEAILPAGTPHAWWNAGDDELHATIELTPAGRFADFITTLFALAQAGRTDARGMPNLLQLAVTAHAYRDAIYPTRPPRAVQAVLFAVLAPIARVLGYTPDVPYAESVGAAMDNARLAAAE